MRCIAASAYCGVPLLLTAIFLLPRTSWSSSTHGVSHTAEAARAFNDWFYWNTQLASDHGPAAGPKVSCSRLRRAAVRHIRPCSRNRVSFRPGRHIQAAPHSALVSSWG